MTGATAAGSVFGRAAMSQATRHLIELGHRSFGLVGGPLTYITARERQAGFLDALHAAGIGEEAIWIEHGDWQIDGSYAAANRLLARTPRPLALLTVELADPTGYGRVLRNQSGRVAAIVEHKDATDEQRAIDEINSGMYAFSADRLLASLGRITTDNAQGEEYLTDVLAIARADGRSVSAHKAADPDEVHGINNRAQLAAATALLRDRINQEHMLAGVTITASDGSGVQAVEVSLDGGETYLPATDMGGVWTFAFSAWSGPRIGLVTVRAEDVYGNVSQATLAAPSFTAHLPFVQR